MQANTKLRENFQNWLNTLEDQGDVNTQFIEDDLINNLAKKSNDIEFKKAFILLSDKEQRNFLEFSKKVIHDKIKHELQEKEFWDHGKIVKLWKGNIEFTFLLKDPKKGIILENIKEILDKRETKLSSIDYINTKYSKAV
jgi:hypothetical protein